ncbi:MAG: thioredoxin [Lawsonibacter sp.]|nr:thioredoxin [Lawsonibacter sp.]
MAMIHFNKETFDKSLEEGKLMMVDFWADWCGPCQMLGPVIESLAEKYEGKAVVGKVNTDEEGELAMRYTVMNIPTVIFFKDGKEIDRKVGVMPPDAFIQVLEQNL